MSIPNPLNLGLVVGDMAVSPALSLCGTMVATTGSPNVYFNKIQAFTSWSLLQPASPIMVYTLPIAQLPIVATYASVSAGTTSTTITSTIVDFTWTLITTPATIPGVSSKTVFINNSGAMRMIDTILPPTFQFLVSSNKNVYIGG